MAEFARADAVDPLIVGVARSIGGGRLAAADFVDRVHRWVRHHVRFVQDRDLAAPLAAWLDAGNVAEVLIRPAELVRMPEAQGDCDDFSMLAAALLRAGGVPVSFRTVAANPAAPRDFSHVYVVAHTPEGNVPVDASHGRTAGWEAPDVFDRRQDWGVGMNGLGCGCDVDYVPGLGLVSTVAPAATAAPWWQQLLQAGTQITQTVLQKPVYQSGPQGTTIYQGQVPTVGAPGTVGIAPNIIPGVSNSTLLLGGLAVLMVMSLGRRR